MNNLNEDIFYEEPEADIILFESEEIITASGDYDGINFEDLI